MIFDQARVNTDVGHGITEKANRVKGFITAVEKRIPFEREELIDDLGIEIVEHHVKGEGLFALTRMALGTSPVVYREARAGILRAVGDVTEPHTLTPRLVNAAWLHFEELHENLLHRPPSAQTEVLRYLFDAGFDVHPVLTYEELSDILALYKPTVEGTFIPKIQNDIVKRYDKPPYLMMRAQIVLAHEQDVCDAVARLIDKSLVGTPFAKMTAEDQEQRMIPMFMPYFEKGLTVGSKKIKTPKLR